MGNNLIVESSKESYKTYIYELGSYKPQILLNGKGKKTEIYYYQLDHLGTPQELTATNGAIAWSAKYKAYGSLAVLEINEVMQPLRFQGQYHDIETGLYYNRYRYYSPSIGRYISPDILKLAGGLNNYQYTHNPIGWIDPLGLIDCPNDPTPKKPTGNYASNPNSKDKDINNINALKRQDETADLLASKGYEVEMLPETRANTHGISPTSRPDLLVDGKVYDVYSPQGGNIDTVMATLEKKSSEQSYNIVLNLTDYKGSISDLETRLATQKIDTLHDLTIIKSDNSVTTFKLPE